MAFPRNCRLPTPPLPPPRTLSLSGIVLCSLKTIHNKRLQRGDQRVKTSRVDSHVVCTSAGLAADAMVLVKDCRVRDRGRKAVCVCMCVCVCVCVREREREREEYRASEWYNITAPNTIIFIARGCVCLPGHCLAVVVVALYGGALGTPAIGIVRLFECV